VGVNRSAPIAVTVGVNVSGVLVAVAKRFWVGAGVALGKRVGVFAGASGVLVAPSDGRLIFERPEQPAKNMVTIMSTRRGNSLFMMKPYGVSRTGLRTLQ